MRKIIIAAVAAVLGASSAPAALAHDFGHDHGHDHRHSSAVVHYHLDGSRKVFAGSHGQAHRIVSLLQSLGAEAHIDGSHLVHYHMHGSRRLAVHSQYEAYRTASELREYGFHVHIDRE